MRMQMYQKLVGAIAGAVPDAVAMHGKVLVVKQNIARGLAATLPFGQGLLV